MNPVPAETVLEVSGLSYVYPNGQRALQDVCFSLKRGEIVGIVGPSGAGKSTLLLHLNGLLPQRAVHAVPSSNGAAVHVAGLSASGEHLAEIRRLVGFLFQDPDDQLFCPTVREDVAFGPLNLGLSREDVERRIAESLALVRLEGYERRSTLQLSLGERKRVCLAGVLACHPLILALDEPFSNLDPRARRTLVDVLQRFDGAQLIATHDLDMVAELCTRVIVLDEGKVRADGPAAVILSDRGLMDRHGLEVPLRLQQQETDRGRANS
ncbi:MAG TPA: ABC transporter ATP-binding protein [Planctomycetaceae bacterium]|jgi:energy-coupling factor transporter ATP-binding protein EcfA2|nr:ABC transporter ATP-binding protein [Planctomycetaceae bacterium]